MWLGWERRRPVASGSVYGLLAGLALVLGLDDGLAEVDQGIRCLSSQAGWQPGEGGVGGDVCFCRTALNEQILCLYLHRDNDSLRPWVEHLTPP